MEGEELPGSVEEIDEMKYPDLQRLAKSLGVKANQKMDKLKSVLKEHLLKNCAVNKTVGVVTAAEVAMETKKTSPVAKAKKTKSSSSSAVVNGSDSTANNSSAEGLNKKMASPLAKNNKKSSALAAEPDLAEKEKTSEVAAAVKGRKLSANESRAAVVEEVTANRGKRAKAAISEETAAETRPAAVESRAAAKPSPAVESRAAAKPSPAVESRVAAKPSPAVESRAAAKPSPAVESRAAAKPSPAVESRTAAKPSPAVERRAAAKPSPAVESRAAAKPSPAVESRTAAKPSPAIERRAAAKPSPAVESRAAAKPSPAVESRAAAKSSPVVESRAAAKPSPAVKQAADVKESDKQVNGEASTDLARPALHRATRRSIEKLTSPQTRKRSGGPSLEDDEEIVIQIPPTKRLRRTETVLPQDENKIISAANNRRTSTVKPGAQTKTQIPRFKSDVNKKPKMNADYWARVHSKEFSKMDSLDDYMKKREERKAELFDSPRVSNNNKTNKTSQSGLARGSTVTSSKVFIPSVLTTSNMNLNFTHVLTSTAEKPHATLPRRSISSVQRGNVPPSSQKPSAAGNTSVRKSLGGFMSPGGEGEGAKKSKFDLKASLARPITWQAHRGALKPFQVDEKVNPSGIKAVKVKTREERREEAERLRQERRNVVTFNKRNMSHHNLSNVSLQ